MIGFLCGDSHPIGGQLHLFRIAGVLPTGTRTECYARNARQARPLLLAAKATHPVCATPGSTAQTAARAWDVLQERIKMAQDIQGVRLVLQTRTRPRGAPR